MANGGLFQAILDPTIANFPEAIAAGQQQAEVNRQRESRDLAGEILGETFTGKIGALARIDPDAALRISSEFGVDPSSKGRFDSFVGSAIAGNQLLSTLGPLEAGQFLLEQADQVDSILGPGTADRTRSMGERLASGDPNLMAEAAGQLAEFATSLQAGPSELDQAKAAKLRAETKLLNNPEKLTGNVDFKDFRALNNDVTSLIKEPLKIRRAAERLNKLGKSKSATDQLAAIFTFMKALDPTSVVREAEQDAARSTGGVTDQFIGFVNSIQGEGALPEAVFESMIVTAKNLSDEAVTGARSELTNSLDAFGDRLRGQDKDRLLNRVPGLFERRTPPGDATTGAAGDLTQMTLEQLVELRSQQAVP